MAAYQTRDLFMSRPPQFKHILDKIFRFKHFIFLIAIFRSGNVKKKPTAAKRFIVGSFSGRV